MKWWRYEGAENGDMSVKYEDGNTKVKTMVVRMRKRGRYESEEDDHMNEKEIVKIEGL